MATTRTYEVRTQDRKVASNSRFITEHNVQVKWINRPDNKVKGQFITLPGGVKFRRATPLTKSVAWSEGKDGQQTVGIPTSGSYKGKPQWCIHSEGGINAGLLFNSVFNQSYPDMGGLGNFITYPYLPLNMRNEVITKCLNEFADQKANIGENLATLRQTLQLVSNPSGSLTKLVKELIEVGRSKKFFPYLRKSVRDIRRAGPVNKTAEEYLKYVYGWKPLMQDVHGLIEMSKASAKQDLLLHAREKKSTTEQAGDKSFRDISNGADLTVNKVDIKSTMRASLWARIDPNYRGTRSLNQLGLVNPASLAWELVPWSFVVDWVLPIGPVLQALTAPAGLLFVDGSIAIRVSGNGDYTLRRSLVDGYIGDGNFQVNTPSTGLIRYEGYRRENITAWPRPGLWFDSDPLRGDRPFKALALLVLKLRSFR